jgi:TatD DNase family protein
MIIDTHCHLFRDDYEDIDVIISNMKDSNIYGITNGTNSKNNKEAIELSNKYNNIYAAIGYHPSEIGTIPNDYLLFLEKNINNIVAIGEIGLDYYWTKDNKDDQINLFKSQLDFAKEHNLPVIIHNREATKDVYDILKQYKLKGVIHAFSGSYETAMDFIKLGYKIGIGGVITFKNSNLKDVVSKIDIKDIVLETDSPYLSPEPLRGKQNSPLNLKLIAEFISNVKNISYEEVCNITSRTAIQLFDLNI